MTTRQLMALVAVTMLGASAVGGQRPRAEGPPQGRPALEQRFRERFAEVVKERVGLNESQMGQLTEVNRNFESRRRALFEQERTFRREMRDLLKPGASEDQAAQERVSQLLQQALKSQRQRLDLLEEEDRAISAFMTPIQRARYFGMQEQMRRRIEELRREAGEGDSLRRRMDGRPMRRRQPPQVP